MVGVLEIDFCSDVEERRESISMPNLPWRHRDLERDIMSNEAGPQTGEAG
jgi:hypothetical protein